MFYKSTEWTATEDESESENDLTALKSIALSLCVCVCVRESESTREIYEEVRSNIFYLIINHTQTATPHLIHTPSLTLHP